MISWLFIKKKNQTITEQTLNFDKNHTLRLLQLLIINYRPENRFYRYKFFTDNCSTRIRDIITQASDDPTLLERPKVESNSTFRQLFTRYLKTMPWSKFGIELLMGTLTDRKAGYDALFIPDYLKEAISLAKINNRPHYQVNKFCLKINHRV